MIVKIFLFIITIFVFGAGFIACGTNNKANPSPPSLTPAISPSAVASQPTAIPSITPAATVTPTPTNTPTPVPTATPEKAKEAQGLWEQGQLAYSQQKYDTAIPLFEKAYQADPWLGRAYAGKGIALCYKKNYKDGMEYLKMAVEKSPSDGYCNYNMAMGYKVQGDLHNTLPWFEKAIVCDPNDTWSYYGISTIYADWDNQPKSLEYLKKAIELDESVKAVAKRQSHFNKMRSNPDFIKITS